MAQALYHQGEIASALAVYEQLRQLQPEDPDIYGILGDIYAEQEQWDAAVEYYQTAVQLNPKLTPVQEALGDIRIKGSVKRRSLVISKCWKCRLSYGKCIIN